MLPWYLAVLLALAVAAVYITVLWIVLTYFAEPRKHDGD